MLIQCWDNGVLCGIFDMLLLQNNCLLSLVFHKKFNRFFNLLSKQVNIYNNPFLLVVEKMGEYASHAIIIYENKCISPLHIISFKKQLLFGDLPVTELVSLLKTHGSIFCGKGFPWLSQNTVLRQNSIEWGELSITFLCE